jgi:hypothetical protein
MHANLLLGGIRRRIDLDAWPCGGEGNITQDQTM